MKVAILGAGAGGLAQAFQLVSLGHDVLLYAPESHKHTIQGVREEGCIHALEWRQSVQAELHGTSPIKRVTTDIAEALEFSNTVMLILPAYAADEIFKLALPHLTKKHMLLVLPGNFAFVRFHKIAQEGSFLKENDQFPFMLIEVSIIPFVCRRVSGNQIFIPGVKKLIHAGVMPSSKTEETLTLLKPLFTCKLRKMKNVLEASFYSLNTVLHPPILLCNTGWVEHTNGKFLFYKHGATTSVMKLVAALDKERVMIGKTLGFEIDDVLTVWKDQYHDTKSVTLDEFVEKAYFYETVLAPPALNHRYLTEDMCYLLLPLLEYVQQKYDLQTPVADSLVTLARIMCDTKLENAIDFTSYPNDFKLL